MTYTIVSDSENIKRYVFENHLKRVNESSFSLIEVEFRVKEYSFTPNNSIRINVEFKTYGDWVITQVQAAMRAEVKTILEINSEFHDDAPAFKWDRITQDGKYNLTFRADMNVWHELDHYYRWVVSGK